MVSIATQPKAAHGLDSSASSSNGPSSALVHSPRKFVDTDDTLAREEVCVFQPRISHAKSHGLSSESVVSPSPREAIDPNVTLAGESALARRDVHTSGIQNEDCCHIQKKVEDPIGTVFWRRLCEIQRALL